MLTSYHTQLAVPSLYIQCLKKRTNFEMVYMEAKNYSLKIDFDDIGRNIQILHSPEQSL